MDSRSASPSATLHKERTSLDSIGRAMTRSSLDMVTRPSDHVRSASASECSQQGSTSSSFRRSSAGAGAVTLSAPKVERSSSISSSKRFDVMAKFLHSKLSQNRWLEEYHENMFYGTANLGAFVRRDDGTYARTTHNPAVLMAVESIGATVAFTLSNDSVSAILEMLDESVTSIPFMDGTVLQVASSVSEVRDRSHYVRHGCYSILCRREHLILVSASSPNELFAHGTSLEGHLVAMIWGEPIAPPAPAVPMITPPRSRSASVSQTPPRGSRGSISFNMPFAKQQLEHQSYDPVTPHQIASRQRARTMSTSGPSSFPQHSRSLSQGSLVDGQAGKQRYFHRPFDSLHDQRNNSMPERVEFTFPSRNTSSTASVTFPSPAYTGGRRSSEHVDPFSTHKLPVPTEGQEDITLDVNPFSKLGKRRMSSVHEIGPKTPPNAHRFGSMASFARRKSSIASPFARKRGSPAGLVPQKEHDDSEPPSPGVLNFPRRQSSVSAIEGDDDKLAELHNFPPRNLSVSSRKESFSSTYNGGYRGSVSLDVEKMVQFVERAMDNEENADDDLERQRDQRRKFNLNHAAAISVAAAGVVALQVWCAAKLVQETRLDGQYTRWVLVVTIPLFGVFSFFFLVVIVSSFFEFFAPLDFVSQNSVYYSGKAPKITEHSGEQLPHITIQMPVYKEGLKGVIMPTITSVLKAVNYYQAHGGTATILVCDDGMQLISEELQEARKMFYELHNIAWVSRPKHCTKPGPDFFLRKGKFKKASNMNYCLEFAGRVEDEFLRLLKDRAKERFCTEAEISVDEEEDLLEEARQTMQEQDNGRTWSAGDVRIGEIILIIDSDTQVPETCLLAGALEMIESPEVAVIQHSSGVMNMTNTTFENGITYFTDLVYTCITFGVAGGDVAPFVGHNAFLRWQAVQSIAFEEDGKTKFWSENHVSEDFDVALRLQMNNFIVRMAGYHKNEFKEGVSLTVYDELARWEKYAYGCNELMFHPLIYWPTKGVFTPLFLKFLGSNMKISSKFTIIAYIGTYYAISVGFPLTVTNYFLAGWQFQLDQYYQTSWHIWVGLAVVYSVLSPLAFAMLRYRMGQKSYVGALGEAIKWMPFFILFFGGLSYHVFKALCCHFFCIPIEWTTTAKELEKTGFKIGLDRVFRDFWRMYALVIPLCALMVYLGLYAPLEYRVTDFTIIVPMVNVLACHALLPFVMGLF